MCATKLYKLLQACPGADLRTKPEPDLRITIRLLHQMNEHVLKTVPKISKAEESALECLKMRTQRQRVRNLPLNCPLRTWNSGWITRQINWVLLLGGGNYRLSPASQTSADLPGRYGCPSTYWRSGSRHLLKMVILHPQLLNVLIEGLSCPKDWSTKTCIEGQSSSLKHIVDAYSIGQKRSLCQSVQNSNLWQRV